MNIHVLKRPIISEKSIKEAEKRKFTFEVARDADKEMIKKAVENQFGVNVVSISTTFVKGRSIRTGKKRTVTPLSAMKKATVLLKEGQSISLFEGGQG